MKKKKRKYIIIAGIILVLIIVIVNVTGNRKNTTEVNVEEVAVKDITEEVSASGWVQPKNRVNITSEVTAEIIAIPVKEGQRVNRGELLVLLDTVQLQKDMEQYSYSLHEMEARTEAAKSLYLQAEEEYDRQQKLFERDLTSETTIQNAEYAFLSSKYNYEAMLNQAKQAKARYEKAIDNLSKTRIVAPMNGVITFLDAEVGEIAAAQTAFTQGKTLMTISNLATFEVEVEVDETEITKVRRNQKAKIEVDAFPDTVFNGEVAEIGNTAVVSRRGTTDQTTNFKVKVLFLDKDVDIKPGMSATVDIVTNEKKDILAVPFGSIVMRTLDADSLARAKGDSSETMLASIDPEVAENDTVSSGEKEKKNLKELKGVFIVEENKAKFVPVETGIADQKDIEVTSGLEAGQKVITGPFRTLRTIKSGTDVNPIEKTETEKS
jgi:HlyD family secretion protein